MAEICVDCMEKSLRKRGREFNKREWVVSDDVDLCERCGKYKPVIVKRRESFLSKILNFIFFRRYY